MAAGSNKLLVVEVAQVGEVLVVPADRLGEGNIVLLVLSLLLTFVVKGSSMPLVKVSSSLPVPQVPEKND